MWQLERDLLFLDVPPTDKPRRAGILVERGLAERPPYKWGMDCPRPESYCLKQYTQRPDSVRCCVKFYS
jgi:hypothetical protein